MLANTEQSQIHDDIISDQAPISAVLYNAPQQWLCENSAASYMTSNEDFYNVLQTAQKKYEAINVDQRTHPNLLGKWASKG